MDTVPTAAQLTGDFSNTRDAKGNLIPIYDPLTACGVPGYRACGPGEALYTRLPFPNNIIPKNRLDPTAVILEKLWAAPNTTGLPFTNVNNFTTNVATGGNNNNVTTRIDHTISDKQRFFGRYSYWNNLNLAADPMHTGECLFGECKEVYTTNDIVLDDTYNFTPTLIADIHVGFDRMVYDRFPIVPTSADLTTIGWPASYNAQIPDALRVIPSVCVTGMSDDLFCLGGVSLGSRIIARTNDWTISGDVTKISGHHTIKMGIQWLMLQDNYAQTNEATGDFRFNANFTQSSPLRGTGGFPFASYLLGMTTNGTSQSIPALVAEQQAYRAFYIGDTWQVTNKLTLNLGLRYEQERPWSERYNRESVWDLTDINPLPASTTLPAKGLLCLVNTSCRSARTSIDPFNKQFAPRLGFAYRLTNDTVLRGAYGIYWIPLNVYWDDPHNDTVNSYSTPFVPTLDGGITPFSTLNKPYPNGYISPPGRSSNYQNLLLGQGPGSFLPVQPYPYMQQWDFDIQRQLPGGLFIDAAYAGSKGTHLSTGTRAINQMPDQYLSMGSALLTKVANPYYGLVLTGALSQPTVAQNQLLRPFPEYTGGSVRWGGFGDSVFHSFQLKVQEQTKGGGMILGAYTVSKLLADVDSYTTWLEASYGGVGGIQDWNCIRCSRALSSNDVPQRLVISYVQNLPVGRGQKYLSPARAGSRVHPVLS